MHPTARLTLRFDSSFRNFIHSSVHPSKNGRSRKRQKKGKKGMYRFTVQAVCARASLPLARVAGVAPFLRDVGDLHPGVVDAAGLPPPRQHIRLRPHPLAVVPAGHHQPELQRPRRRLRRAPRRPVLPRHEPPVGRPHLRASDKKTTPATTSTNRRRANWSVASLAPVLNPCLEQRPGRINCLLLTVATSTATMSVWPPW